MKYLNSCYVIINMSLLYITIVYSGVTSFGHRKMAGKVINLKKISSEGYNVLLIADNGR